MSKSPFILFFILKIPRQTTLLARNLEFLLDSVLFVDFGKFFLLTKHLILAQGQVESIARKSPKELTALFEHISGSEQFKEEYDRLLRDRDHAKEHANFMEKKRKGLKVEQREYKEQKKEAEKHAKMAEQLAELKLTYILFQLYHLANDMKAVQDSISARRKDLGEVTTRIIGGKAELDKLRAAQAAATKAFDALERRLAQQRKKAESDRTDSTVKENERRHLARKVAQLTQELEEAEEMHEKAKVKCQQLQRDLETLDEAEATFMKEQEEAMKLVESNKLTEAQLREFAELKDAARTQTSQQRAELLALNREQNADISLLEESYQPSIADYEAKLQILEEEELPSAKLNAETQKRRLQALELEHTQYDEELTRIAQQNRATIDEKQKVEEELAQVQEELKQARVDINETERQAKMDDCVATMKRLFAGVYGRVIDLIQPTQDRYRIAISVALGANMDAIVVADKATAINCIQYMKEQRIGIATFLPMDSLHSKVAYDELRVLEAGAVKPVFDIIKFDKLYHSAMEYVCGSTLVCASLEKARQFAFHNVNNKRYKVVTFDGMLISKSGLMTGGTLGGHAGANGKGDSRSQRWEMKAVSELKTKRDALILRLQDLNGAMRSVTRERELQTNIATTRAKIETVKADLSAANAKVASLEKKIKEDTKKLAVKRAEADEANQSIDARLPEIGVLNASIADVEDEIFANFSKKVGIPNLREWEETRLVRLKLLAEKGLTFKTQRARIQNLLDYATQQEKRMNESTALRKTLDEAIARQKKIDEELSKLSVSAKQSDADRAEENEEYESKKAESNKAEADLRAALRNAEEREKLKDAIMKAVHSKEASLKQLQDKRHQVLESARNDDIALPTLDEEGNPKKSLKKSKTGKKGAKKRSRKDSDEEEGEEEEEDGDDEEEENEENVERMDVDDEETPELKSTQSMSIHEIEDRRRKESEIVVDFSELGEEYKSAKTTSQREEKLATLAADIQNVGAQLQSIAPNYRANTRLGEVGDSIDQVETEIENAHTRAQDFRSRYVDIREQRNRLFVSTFEKINDKINDVYKALTGGFGQAHLESSVDAPYSNPITYSLAPKSKAFTDIQHLSGGEQSVAALALLFAIQSVHPSPFFVLDEVDAALDSDNVGVVAEYFKTRSTDLQFIVISLKDKCFEKADALVGVCQDRSEATSRSITLDLNRICGGGYRPVHI